MKYLDYLSFSQKSTTALRPTHSLFVTTLLSEIIPEPANIPDVFASTHYILSK